LGDSGSRAPDHRQPGRRGLGGRLKLSGISRKVREILARDADLHDIVQGLDHAGELAGRCDATSLTNADVLVETLLGVALNRSRKVTVADQLRAIGLIRAHVDGRPGGGGAARSRPEAEEVEGATSSAQFQLAVRLYSAATVSPPQSPRMGAEV
jgi:hypothetical protein